MFHPESLAFSVRLGEIHRRQNTTLSSTRGGVKAGTHAGVSTTWLREAENLFSQKKTAAVVRRICLRAMQISNEMAAKAERECRWCS